MKKYHVTIIISLFVFFYHEFLCCLKIQDSLQNLSDMAVFPCFFVVSKKLPQGQATLDRLEHAFQTLNSKAC